MFWLRKCFAVFWGYKAQAGLALLQPASASQVMVPPCPAQNNFIAQDQCLCLRGNWKPGVVPHSGTCSTRKLEARRSSGQGHLQPLAELLAWGTLGSCLKKKNYKQKEMSLRREWVWMVVVPACECSSFKHPKTFQTAGSSFRPGYLVNTALVRSFDEDMHGLGPPQGSPFS